MSRKPTFTAHGAILSDEEGYVTHEILRPGPFGLGWLLYERDGYAKRSVGIYATLEEAVEAAG